jgi:hypothetical protein
MLVLASHSKSDDDGNEGTKVDKDEGFCDLSDNLRTERVEETVEEEEGDEDGDSVAGSGDVSTVSRDGSLGEVEVSAGKGKVNEDQTREIDARRRESSQLDRTPSRPHRRLVRGG